LFVQNKIKSLSGQLIYKVTQKEADVLIANYNSIYLASNNLVFTAYFHVHISKPFDVDEKRDGEKILCEGEVATTISS